jgi:hypothetical protein
LNIRFGIEPGLPTYNLATAQPVGDRVLAGLWTVWNSLAIDTGGIQWLGGRGPPDVQGRLRAYWKKRKPAGLRVLMTNALGENILGECWQEGYLLKFNTALEAPGVSQGDIERVVAHELAHVWVHATTPKRWGQSALNKEQREEATIRIAEGWGYPRPSERLLA